MSDVVTLGFEFGRLLVTLGLEVYRAIEEGDDSKTVRQVFDGVQTDRSKLKELEDARFGSGGE